MKHESDLGPDRADEELDRRLSALVREAEPAASVWAGIESRIERPRRRYAAPLALAAAVVLAVVISVVQWGPEAPGALSDPARVFVQAEAEAMRRAAPVETGGLVDALPLADAWAENQTAIEELEAALERDPDNRLLLDFLAEARLRQVQLLNSGLALFPQTEA